MSFQKFDTFHLPEFLEDFLLNVAGCEGQEVVFLVAASSTTHAIQRVPRFPSRPTTRWPSDGFLQYLYWWKTIMAFV